jgi:hypothetical protein
MTLQFDENFDGRHADVNLIDDKQGPSRWMYKADWLGKYAPETCWLKQGEISPERIGQYWEKKRSEQEMKQRTEQRKRFKKRQMRKPNHKRMSNIRTAT